MDESSDDELGEFVDLSDMRKIRRRIHMDAVKCLKHASSSQGGLPLTNPVVYKTVFQKRGKGILSKTEFKYKEPPLNFLPQASQYQYPRKSTTPYSSKPSTCGSSIPDASELDFVKASEIPLSQPSPYSSTMQDISPRKIKKAKKDEPPPRNTILNYYSPTKFQSHLSRWLEINHEITQELKVADIETERKIANASACDNFSSHTYSLKDDCFKSNSFGLLGEEVVILDDDDDNDNHCVKFDYFSIIPTEIFEAILCQIPILDLLLSLNRVSRYWYDVINNDQFMPWKKRYYKVKAGLENEIVQFNIICEAIKKKSIKYCYETFFSFIKSSFSRQPSEDVIMQLRQHSKYKEAKDVLHERFPEYMEGDRPNVWCLIGCLVLISETLFDVYNIIKYLTIPASRCPVNDALECLYCIATFLLYCKNEFNINHGLHYRVYYALYIFENQWSGTIESLDAVKQNSTGQQSILKYTSSPDNVKLTHEQMRIINHKLQKGHIVKIVAFAGTGKTSTLKEYARLRPSMKFLNVVFNKAVCNHASKCFTANVECRTAHSLAWEKIGNKYKRKLTAKVKALDIIEFVKKDETISISQYQYAWCVLSTISNFMASGDDFISTAHVPSQIAKQDRSNTVQLKFSDKQFISKDAERIWNKMADINDYDVRITHDGYLKLYQLMHPKLLGYSCIFVDEAQDCNAATLDFLLSQSCPKILVGDPNQQLYAFRGAVNALQSIPCTHTYYLTQSFRFGPEIAYVASCALEVMQRIQQKTLVGGTQQGSVSGQREGQLAVIARTNATLFNEAVRICCHKDLRGYEPATVRGAFAGGIYNYGLDDLKDIYLLMMNQSKDSFPGDIKNRFLRRFKSFADLQHYAKNTEDNELQGKIRLVLQHRDRIPEYVSTIKEKCKHPMDMATIVFTTAHKSKGLEFDTVCLTEDYSIGDIPCEYGNPTRTAEQLDEFNVLYVAITRAKKCLMLSTCAYFVLLGAQEKFEYPVSSEKVISELGTDTLKCVNCEIVFKLNRKLVLGCRKLILAGDVTLASGYLCINCSSYPRMNIPFVHPTHNSSSDIPLEDITHRIGASLFGPFHDEPIPGRPPCPPYLDLLEGNGPEVWEELFDTSR